MRLTLERQNGAAFEPMISPHAGLQELKRMQNFNILFILTDQQAHFGAWPTGYSLPGLEKLREAGVSFRRLRWLDMVVFGVFLGASAVSTAPSAFW
jgi:hypothetical protein